MSWHAIVVPYSDREDWLAKRRQGIGASDVAGILGLSPYASPFTVWAEKTQNVEKDVSDAMHFGKRLEAVIEAEFTDRTGLYIGGRELLVHHPEVEWAMATLDGYAMEHPEPETIEDEIGGPLSLVEFKTDGSFGRWDEVPTKYQIQVQHQMFVTGMEQSIVACLHGGRRFELYEVEADVQAQQAMLDRVSVFREKYLVDPDAGPPDVDEHPATARVIADLWSDPTEDEIELSHENYADVEAWRAARVRLAEAKAEVDRLKARIAVALQEAVVGSWQGVPLVTFKQQTRKEHMVRESSFRVLREVGSKED